MHWKAKLSSRTAIQPASGSRVLGIEGLSTVLGLRTQLVSTVPTPRDALAGGNTETAHARQELKMLQISYGYFVGHSGMYQLAFNQMRAGQLHVCPDS
jgi:hypothetical protein